MLSFFDGCIFLQQIQGRGEKCLLLSDGKKNTDIFLRTSDNSTNIAVPSSPSPLMTSVYVIHLGFDTWWRLTDPPPSLTHTTTWVKDLKLILCTLAVRQRNGLPITDLIYPRSHAVHSSNITRLHHFAMWTGLL